MFTLFYGTFRLGAQCHRVMQANSRTDESRYTGRNRQKLRSIDVDGLRIQGRSMGYRERPPRKRQLAIRRLQLRNSAGIVTLGSYGSSITTVELLMRVAELICDVTG